MLAVCCLFVLWKAELYSEMSPCLLWVHAHLPFAFKELLIWIWTDSVFSRVIARFDQAQYLLVCGVSILSIFYISSHWRTRMRTTLHFPFSRSAFQSQCFFLWYLLFTASLAHGSQDSWLPLFPPALCWTWVTVPLTLLFALSGIII